MKENEQAERSANLAPEKSIFWPALLSVLLVSLPMLLWPKASEEVINAIYQPFSLKFGSLYLWFTVGLIVLCLYFCVSRWGDIKFGEPDEKPQYSLMSWIAMVFCSGVAGACMFWAIVEPMWDLLIPPQYAQPMSTEAYDWSLSYLLLHWGPNAWASYFIVALPIAYLFHIRRKPVLRISSAAETILGSQTNGFIGRTCDIFFILGMLFCTAVTMCISLPTVEAALVKVFGIKPGFNVQLYILIVSASIAAWSVWSGLNKGIKVLSNINIAIALAMIGYGALVGPTASLFDIFTNAFGKLLGNYWNMTFWTSPFSDSTFPRDWTIFYALFWAGYGPFMGLFIARISRGRTVREVIAWGLIGTCAGGYLIHGVFGSYTLYAQYHGIVDAVAILKESGGPTAMMAVLDTLPFGKVVMCVYCVFSTIFLATSVDSGCYVVSSVATSKMTIYDDPARWHRSLWALVQALLALGLLSIGGLGVAKVFGNFSGALTVLPSLLLTMAWIKIIMKDGSHLLCNYVDRTCKPSGMDQEFAKAEAASK